MNYNAYHKKHALHMKHTEIARNWMVYDPNGEQVRSQAARLGTYILFAETHYGDDYIEWGALLSRSNCPEAPRKDLVRAVAAPQGGEYANNIELHRVLRYFWINPWTEEAILPEDYGPWEACHLCIHLLDCTTSGQIKARFQPVRPAGEPS